MGTDLGRNVQKKEYLEKEIIYGKETQEHYIYPDP